MSDKNLTKIIAQEDIENKVKLLALQISEDYKGLNPVLIGVLKGCFIFLGDLIRNLDIIHEVDFIKISSYRDGSTNSEIKLVNDITTSIDGRNIIIVEDIVDTGNSLNFLKDHLANYGPESMKTCTLVYRKNKSENCPEIEYKGFEIEEGFLIGYGMDYGEWGRNLRDIYIVEE